MDNRMTNTGIMTDMDLAWNSPAHRAYLAKDALRQFDFFKRSLDPRGGFHYQDFTGQPIAGSPRELHATGRMVHAYALGHLAGVPGAADMVDHGMKALWDHHRDARHGGYVWSFASGGTVVDSRKLAYGHAFVLLAGASAKQAGHPLADRLIEDALDVIENRYWESEFGLLSEEYAEDWSEISTYRGMNANMHYSEALIGLAEATGDLAHLRRAEGIFGFFVGQIASQYNWRIPEHFDRRWNVDGLYEGNPMFRPAGTTPGHSLELSRLLLQAWDLGGRAEAVLTEWSERLYERACNDGWHQRNGAFMYTVDVAGVPLRPARYWWPVTEAIGAAAARMKQAPSSDREREYTRYWQVARDLFIDEHVGGWIPEVDEVGRPSALQFAGKPDIYHSIQADLYPLVGSLSNIASSLPNLQAIEGVEG